MIDRNKYFFFFSLLVLFHLITTSSFAQINELIYQSPVQNSVNNSLSTNVIIKVNQSVDQEMIKDELFQLSGINKNYAFEVLFYNNNKTILIEPNEDFKFGDCIDLKIKNGENLLGTSSISFNVCRSDMNFIRDPEEGAEQPAIEKAVPFFYPPVVVHKYDTTAEGVLFLNGNVMGSSKSLIITNNEGTPVFFRLLDNLGFDFKKQPDGSLSYFEYADDGKFYIMDSTYSIVDSFAAGNGYLTDIHDIQILPNGNALLIGWNNPLVDMDTVVTGGQKGVRVVEHMIQEIDKTTKNVLFQWRTSDHFKITETVHEDLTATRTLKPFHCNSIEVDSDNNLLLSFRNMDEITKIDFTTGEIIWRLGGKSNDFEFINDDLKFSSQHDARRIANGNITIFDNAHYTDNMPRAVEYELDEVAKTATLVWQQTEATVPVSDIYGSVQRLDNGNTLIDWGRSNVNSVNVSEVKPDGTVVFNLTLSPLEGSNSYRAFRYDWCDSTCYLAINEMAAPNDFVLYNYPNPFKEQTIIHFNLREAGTVKIQVYDLLGNLIKVVADKNMTKGMHEVTFDATNVTAGVYLYTIEMEGYSLSRKIVVDK
ncbi:MAG: aryl-sulfate sulfotransferase [Flavobacteriales bacterium]|nr:aryl-sulfate sulfotransferase [Flavobacteriales bacterium]